MHCQIFAASLAVLLRPCSSYYLETGIPYDMVIQVTSREPEFFTWIFTELERGRALGVKGDRAYC